MGTYYVAEPELSAADWIIGDGRAFVIDTGSGDRNHLGADMGFVDNLVHMVGTCSVAHTDTELRKGPIPGVDPVVHTGSVDNMSSVVGSAPASDTDFVPDGFHILGIVLVPGTKLHLIGYLQRCWGECSSSEYPLDLMYVGWGEV